MLRTSLRLHTVRLLPLIAGFSGILPHSDVSAAPPAVATLMSTANSSRPGDASLANFPTKYPWKTNIVGTIFWVGEEPTENNPVPNTSSSWDPRWMTTFGGFDDPDITARAAGYRPAGFVPKQNPFYIALPYNDVVNYKTTKEEASKVIPWFKDRFVNEGKSVCHNRWIAIRHGDKTCYAQWSDCGPFVTTDADYVFGDARPTNSKNNGAGIDLAPAVRDYLGFVSGRTCDWRFVEESEVPDGPWKDYGRNNPFSLDADKVAAMPTYSKKSKSTKSVGPTATRMSVTNADAASSRLEELRKQRDLWFQQNGAKGR